ncbi:ABC transporter substrate-binding protein [Microbacterium sp. 22242]|uniref:ABC transporter substrate-binding protein n=1 Tax=Microbacterium sp. 22242 TaxID=3453896 RepID=UPI003F87FF86
MIPASAPPPGISRRSLLRLLAVTGSAALLSPALAACASTPTAPIRSGAVDLSFWTHDDGYIAFFTKAVPLADANSSFRYALDITKAGAADIVTKLIAQAVAGTGTPDVVGLEIGNFARMLRGDIAAELLSDFTAAVAPIKDDLITARLTPFSKDGRLYALDSDTPLTVLYHRADEYERLGLSTDFGTWEEFGRVGAALAKREGVALGAVATSDPGGTVQNFQIHLLQRGGDLFDADGKDALQTPEAEDALAFLAKSVQSGALATVADMYGPSVQSGLKSGKILGVNMPSWYASYGIKPNVPEQKGKWRIAALPRFAKGGGRTAVGGGTGFAALRGKPGSEAGMHLITTAYLEPAQQVARYKAMGYLPTRRSVFDSAELAALEDDYFGGQRLFETYRDIVDDVPDFHQSANSSIMSTVLSGHILRAYKGQVSAAQALADATTDFRGQARR